MRTISGLLILLLTIGLVVLLNRPLGKTPAIGPLIDPINGCWVNAEAVNKNFSTDLKFPSLTGDAKVWLDERMVPHIHAANDHDLYFLEGYVHAYFRLWQMDLETRAAAGRVSEVLGPSALDYDRKQRRKGMIYGAENSLSAMEADPRTKQMVSAYTEGINHFISSLKFRNYPLEYKLMGFAPEPWTNLKSSLMLKFMADDLTGATDDIPLTYLRDMLPPEDLSRLFPGKIAGSTPVIPRGTIFDKPSLTVPPVPADSVFPHITTAEFDERKEDGKGSNNWAVGGMRTQSGAAILCNDPHLGLNLPSLWFEVQLQAPGMNAYGASLPGAPGIIIGFNDSLAWGFTNNYRDVKDFYLIKPVDDDKNKYWFSGKQMPFEKRIEHIAVKGGPEYVDTVCYTIHGPVLYDARHPTPGGYKKPLAMCWMGHKASNELMAIYLLNRAKDYNSFVDAIINFQCPAQNMVYADRAGNIALWGQGQFVNKWPGQGVYIMNGTDSSTLWRELIPMRENPHVLNPAQGYVSSANQSVTDDSYPYWYNGNFRELRAWRINQVLNGTQKATVSDMFALQNDNYSVLAANTLPLLLKYLPARSSDKYIEQLKQWDYRLEAGSIAASVYHLWWTFFYTDLWKDKFAKVPDQFWPLTERTMQLFMTDSLPMYCKDCEKLSRQSYFSNIVALSYKQAVDSLDRAGKSSGGREWFRVKNTMVRHLTKLPALSYDHLQIGGWGNTVNATKTDHGPSWRMVVQMGKEIEAYGVYPGGQSGNPGSKYYADFLQHWVEGKYYRLQFLPYAEQQNNSSIKYTWTVHH